MHVGEFMHVCVFAHKFACMQMHIPIYTDTHVDVKEKPQALLLNFYLIETGILLFAAPF